MPTPRGPRRPSTANGSIGARHEGGVQRLGVPVDLAATRELIDLAGPVQAWTGEPVEEPGSFS